METENGLPNDALETAIRVETNGRRYSMVTCADCGGLIREAYDVDRCGMCGNFVCSRDTHIHQQSTCPKLRQRSSFAPNVRAG